MTIRAFKMQLKPGAQAEYARRHDVIWPELSRLLRDSGIRDYSIFLDPDTLALFAIMSLEPGHRIEELPDHPIMRRWWDHMAPLMEVAADNKPLEWPLQNAFYFP